MKLTNVEAVLLKLARSTPRRLPHFFTLYAPIELVHEDIHPAIEALVERGLLEPYGQLPYNRDYYQLTDRGAMAQRTLSLGVTWLTGQEDRLGFKEE